MPLLVLMISAVTEEKMSKTPCTQLDSFGFSHGGSLSYFCAEYRTSSEMFWHLYLIDT